MNHRELTMKEYAALERVSYRTVRRWVEKGAVPIRRTPGGGIRIIETRSVVVINLRPSVDTCGHPAN